MKIITALLLLLLLAGSLYADGIKYIQHISNITIRSIALENHYVWCATDSGVIRFNNQNGEIVKYTKEDGLLSNKVLSVAVDHDDIKWFGTSGKLSDPIKEGVCWFDGISWDSKTSDNWGNFTFIMAIVVDKNNVKWFSAPQTGILFYDGLNWGKLDDSSGQYTITFDDKDRLWCAGDSQIFRYTGTIKESMDYSDWTYLAIIEDNNRVMWFGSEQGVKSYDGINWKVFDYRIINGVTSIAIDKNNVKWFGTYTGLWSFDNKQWIEIYNEDNYYPDIYTIKIDDAGVIWAGGKKGLISYYPKTVTNVKNTVYLAEIRIIGISPNPFNSFITLTFLLPSSGSAVLSIYSLTGQKVRTLVSGNQTAGTHSVSWDGRDDSGRAVSSGVYLSRLRMGEKVAIGRMLLLK